MTDRITKLRIRGLRAIEGIELDLEGLTVLIGENGTGKSSIIEALEILRLAGKPIDFVPDVIVRAHGGLTSLMRRGAKEVFLGVTIEGDGPKLEYLLAVADIGNTPQVVDEHVLVSPTPGSSGRLSHLARNESTTLLFDLAEYEGQRPPDGELAVGKGKTETVLPYRLAVPWLAHGNPTLQRVANVLERMEVHVPFETRPLWQQHQLLTRAGPRWPSQVEHSSALARFALDLPNAYQQIRNLDPDVAARVLDRLRLGIDPDIRNFVLTPAGGGHIELQLLFGRWPREPLPIHALSEGQIAYLAFVALVELNGSRSVLAFDEPELHLHPALLGRVVMMIEEVAQGCPVIVATQSDRLLDALSSPASTVVLCELDANLATRLVRPNPERLKAWLEDYSGLGSIRAAGYERHVFDPDDRDGGKP